MSNFFDKVKKGVSNTSTKTEIMIQTNKLKNQISQEENRIQGIYRDMGQKIFEAYERKEMNNLESLVDDNCVQIVALQNEIKNLELNIEELNKATDEELPADVVEPTPETLSEPIDVHDDKDISPDTVDETIEEIIDEVEIKADLDPEEIEKDRIMGEVKTDLEKIVKEVESEIEDEEIIEEEMVLMEMRCTNCHAEINPDFKFCMNCGAPIPEKVIDPIVDDNRCPSCNKKVSPGAKFCRHCGSPV